MVNEEILLLLTMSRCERVRQVLTIRKLYGCGGSHLPGDARVVGETPTNKQPGREMQRADVMLPYRIIHRYDQGSVNRERLSGPSCAKPAGEGGYPRHDSVAIDTLLIHSFVYET